MKIAISGSSGLVGTALSDYFHQKYFTVRRILREPTSFGRNDGVIRWNIPEGKIDTDMLEGLDVVIHLGGENIAGGRWMPEHKKKILDSRIEPTTQLSQALARLQRPPKVFLCASAIGFYGYETLSEVDESSPKGQGFLADVCSQWEKATRPAEGQAIRVVNLRMGMVVSEKGGALEKMLPVFRLGLGGKIGSGKQMVSWIGLNEIPLIVEHLLRTESCSGPVNLVTAYPVTNLELTRYLGKALGRPTVFPLPAFMAKTIFGDMGKELLLSGIKVRPKKLEESGYVFRFPNLDEYLKRILRP